MRGSEARGGGDAVSSSTTSNAVDAARGRRCIARRAAIVAVLAAAISGLPRASAQPPTQPPPGPAAPAQGTGAEPRLVLGEQVTVDVVLVPVIVRNVDGHVRDLTRDSFLLRIDGEPVPIASFDRGPDAPIALLLLQDLSGSMELAGRLELSRRVAYCLLDAAGPADRFALASFTTGRVQVDASFTGNLGALEQLVGGWRGYGTTALHDAVGWLPDVAMVDGGSRRAAVLLTDGVDNASQIDPVAARYRVRRAHLPVYVLALDQPEAGDVEAGPEADANAEVLEMLALETGGQPFSVLDEASADRACEAILDDLRYEYVLGFPTAGAGEVRYREIEVQVAGSGYEVSYRQGYEGRAPEVAGVSVP